MTTTKTKTYASFGGNIEIAKAMQELRRSNATVPKPVRAQRKQRSRSGARRAALKEW